MDAITLRGIERLLIVIGAIFFGYLGYRLFEKGATEGNGNLKFESKVMKIIFSGTGPGLFFMAFGAIVLVVSILYGGATVRDSTLHDVSLRNVSDNNSEQLSRLQHRASALESENHELKRVLHEQTLLVKVPPTRNTNAGSSSDSSKMQSVHAGSSGESAEQVQMPPVQHERIEILKK